MKNSIANKNETDAFKTSIIISSFVSWIVLRILKANEVFDVSVF